VVDLVLFVYVAWLNQSFCGYFIFSFFFAPKQLKLIVVKCEKKAKTSSFFFAKSALTRWHQVLTGDENYYKSHYYYFFKGARR
jgi:hypothetical protein